MRTRISPYWPSDTRLASLRQSLIEGHSAMSDARAFSGSPWILLASSRGTTAPTLVSVGLSGIYQNQPLSKAAQKMLPEFGSGRRLPPS